MPGYLLVPGVTLEYWIPGHDGSRVYGSRTYRFAHHHRSVTGCNFRSHLVLVNTVPGPTQLRRLCLLINEGPCSVAPTRSKSLSSDTLLVAARSHLHGVLIGICLTMHSSSQPAEASYRALQLQIKAIIRTVSPFVSFLACFTSGWGGFCPNFSWLTHNPPSDHCTPHQQERCTSHGSCFF